MQGPLIVGTDAEVACDAQTEQAGARGVPRRLALGQVERVRERREDL